MALINSSTSGSPSTSYSPRFIGKSENASFRRDMAKVKAFVTRSAPPAKTEEQLARAADRAERDAVLATLPKMQHQTTYYCPEAPRRESRASVRQDMRKVKAYFHREQQPTQYVKDVDADTLYSVSTSASDESTICEKQRKPSAREIASVLFARMNDVGERRQRARAAGYQ